MKKKIGVLLLALYPSLVLANPADYIYSPIVEFGEREVDIKYGYASPLDGNNDYGGSAGFGYGAKKNWFTEAYLKRAREGGSSSTIAEWENKFQLAETGEYPVDMGLITEVEAPLSGDAPWELRVGTLFQTDFGKLQLNGNLLLERAFGSADETGARFNTNFLYQWQAKYRWRQPFEFGVQVLGDMGKWDQWNQRDEQDHRMGPAVFGKLVLAPRQVIRYNAAWLLGASQAAPNHVFRLQVEYEF